jgi:hypothetical protein
MQCRQASIELEKPNFHFLVLMVGGEGICDWPSKEQ